MEQLDQIAALLALTMGAAWASGINLYAAIFMLGMIGATGNMDLPPGLEVCKPHGANGCGRYVCG